MRGKDGVAQVKREGRRTPGSGNDLCKDPAMGRGQEDRQKVPVAGVPRAVRTVGELSWGVAEPGGALPHREVAFVLRPEYSCS